MLAFRETRLSDIDALFDVRGRTRQNPLSRADLAQLGITPQSTAAAFGSGEVVGFVCTHNNNVVGFCSGKTGSGEILVLAVTHRRTDAKRRRDPGAASAPDLPRAQPYWGLNFTKIGSYIPRRDPSNT